MEITKEQIREDILDYISRGFNRKSSSKDVNETTTMFDCKMNDFDLIDMELDLEEKYGHIQNEDEECNISGIHSYDTLLEVVNKLFDYFKGL